MTTPPSTGGAAATVARLPRGIRLNNPGNMDRVNPPWNGQSIDQPDLRFAAFLSPVWGLRAMMKQFRTYARREIDTPRKIIETWAPPKENQTDAYLANVCRAIGKTPDTALDCQDAATLIALAKAITHQEQGTPPVGYPPHWFADAVYEQAAHLALTT